MAPVAIAVVGFLLHRTSRVYYPAPGNGPVWSDCRQVGHLPNGDAIGTCKDSSPGGTAYANVVWSSRNSTNVPLPISYVLCYKKASEGQPVCYDYSP